MRFLVDENLSKKKKFINEHPEFSNVSDIIRKGAKDEEVIEKAEGFIIITKDKKLALNALIAGIQVWYYDERGIEHKLLAKKLT